MSISLSTLKFSMAVHGSEDKFSTISHMANNLFDLALARLSILTVVTSALSGAPLLSNTELHMKTTTYHSCART